MPKEKKKISANTAWLYVLIGGLLEIVWITALKSDQIPGLVVIISLIISFDLIIRATTVLPVGTTYAVFTAIGVIGTVGVEIVFLQEKIQVLKIALILLLALFVIGLKLTSTTDQKE